MTEEENEDLDNWLRQQRKPVARNYVRKYKTRREIRDVIGEVKEPDWERLVWDIRQAGVPLSFLSEAIGMHPCTLSAWLCNSKGGQRRMSYKLGATILKVHKKFCKDKANGSST